MISYLPMKEEYIDGMVEVEKQCFNSGFAEKTFKKELKNKIAMYVVAIDGDNVLGYAGLWNICGVADIIDVAVHRDFRRLGIAYNMLVTLIKAVRASGASEINLEVRVSNGAAQALYHKLNFEIVGQRPNYYQNRETAILMKRIFTEEE